MLHLFQVFSSLKIIRLTKSVSDKYNWNFDLQVVLLKQKKVSIVFFIDTHSQPLSFFMHIFAQMLKHKKIHRDRCSNQTLNVKDMVLGIYHQYGNVGCDRWSPGSQSENRVKNSSLWTVTIPHPKYSGRCFTYRYNFYYKLDWHSTRSSPRTGILFLIRFMFRFNSEQDQDV